MGYSDPKRGLLMNRAKSRALARLLAAHPDEYARLYEVELAKLGLVRVPRGRGDVGGKGPMVWKQVRG